MSTPGAAADGAGPSPPRPPALRLSGITKRFGPLLANDGISLEVARGEVLALLGENGAGKSTLVSILFGHYVADAGTVEVDGAALPPGRPRAALAAGVGMVHQHFTLADNLSVLDNVMLGAEPLWRPRARRAQARARLLAEAARLGLHVDPQARVGDLSVGERQRVEILKALAAAGGSGGPDARDAPDGAQAGRTAPPDAGDGRGRTARVLVLDEPTAVLTPAESESLFATLARMVAQGLAVVFISHKLDEVLRISHRIAVLRGGRLVAVMPAAGADRTRLAEAMVGRTVEPARRRAAADAAGATGPAAAPVLALRQARVDGRGRGARPLLDVASLAVQAGEIVAVAGVAGNGQAVLADVLCGERALAAGTLTVAGRALPPSPAAFVDAGVARVPEDRHRVGAIGELSLWENLALERRRERPLSRAGWLDRRAAQAWAARLLRRFDVRGAEADGVAATARRLSGGNLQKLILARVLGGAPGAAAAEHATPGRDDGGAGPDAGATAAAPPPPLIVVNQPTWGLDVGAVAAVHQRLLDAAAAGSAVLVISEDLDEVFALGDRIAVMHQGRLGPARPAAQWTPADIGLAMAGDRGRADADDGHDGAGRPAGTADGRDRTGTGGRGGDGSSGGSGVQRSAQRRPAVRHGTIPTPGGAGVRDAAP